MKFRTKLFYSFISLGLMGTLLALLVIYGEASRLIFNEIRGRVLSIVSNTVHLIDPNTLRAVLISNGDKDSAEYRDLESQLEQIRDLNRRGDIFAQYVYIIRKERGSDHYNLVIKTPKEYFPVGEDKTPLDTANLPQTLKKPYVTRSIRSNIQGTWITGYAPILDDQGNELAILGVDVRTREIYIELERLLLYGLIAFIASVLFGMIFAYVLSKMVSSSLSTLCKTVQKIGEGDFSFRSVLQTKDEFNELSIAINTMAKGLQERERLKMGFKRYVSQYALEELLKLDKPISLEGERKKVTILFSDIREFTSIAERLPPEEVLKLLNEYFEEMIEVIFSYSGTLDKFIGDGMMVEFGAPLDDKFQEINATLAAIHMQLRLEKLCKKWQKEGRETFCMGIGIHTGLAVLGNIGSEKRMEYTAIGDAVNVASRLELLTKQVKKPIIISHTVYEKIKEHFVFEDLNEAEIRGRVENIRAYAIVPDQQKNLDQIELIQEMNRLEPDK